MIAPNTLDAPAPLPGGNLYAEGLYCSTDVRRGVIRTRSGARLVCLTSDFLIGFRRAILDECGPAAPMVLKTCGRKWGGFIARRFDADVTAGHGRPVRDLTLAEFQAALGDLFSHHGWGLVRVDLSRHDRGVVSVTVDNPLFASLGGPTDGPVEALTAGILAGFFGAVFEQDLDCVQTACVSRGAPAARFVVALAARLAGAEDWVASGTPHETILARLDEVRA